MVFPVKLHLTALRLDFAFPSLDVGPVDFWAFSRFAAKRSAEMGSFFVVRLFGHDLWLLLICMNDPRREGKAPHLRAN